MLSDFLDAIQQDRDPAITGEEAVATQRVIDAILDVGKGCMRNTASLALGFSAALVMGVAAATLDVKPGLWEVTTQGETTGLPPIPPQMLAQMSPQQREQAMAAMGRMNQPHVSRACVTQKMLDRGMTFIGRATISARRP